MPASSASNRMAGLVTRVDRDGLLARVQIQAGPFQVVSVMAVEVVDELGLEPGSLAVASVPATHVMVEVPRRGSRG
jgi:molybdopterin-binding protein